MNRLLLDHEKFYEKELLFMIYNDVSKYDAVMSVFFIIDTSLHKLVVMFTELGIRFGTSGV